MVMIVAGAELEAGGVPVGTNMGHQSGLGTSTEHAINRLL